jgi:pimeloyl-ACP methyl ester carboxylesterase
MPAPPPQTDPTDVTIIAADRPRCVALFAAGRGGDPRRHLPLLGALAAQGCTVVAPRLPMLVSTVPSKAELDDRLRRLEAAADAHARTDLPLAGLGHSIGAVSLLSLAGGRAETIAGERALSGSKWTFARLVLLAPPTDFFRRPGALDAVTTPVRIWAGARDAITPPAQALFLQQALAGRAPVDVRIDQGAGHFTYMDELPPNAADPHPDRAAFLAALAARIGQFLVA